MDQLPAMMDYDIRHGRTYMYFKGKPLYPFGFGLSYTTFRLSNLRVDKGRVAEDGTVDVSIDVTNRGVRAGDAVPQLYLHHRDSKVQRPEQQLVGFRRIHLEPGETKTVHITVKPSQFAYWNQARKTMVVEHETVELMAGRSSADIVLRRNLLIS